MRAETDYDVSTDGDERGWFVEETTKATTFSRDPLAQWVKWMMAAGYRYGRCEFDGWGTSIPA